MYLLLVYDQALQAKPLWDSLSHLRVLENVVILVVCLLVHRRVVIGSVTRGGSACATGDSRQ
jgi:hypothetical protein